MTQIQDKIIALKKERGTLILAHYYQPLEVQDIADYVADSFALAKKAQQSPAKSLILCGVRFMAESAKILSPEKDVYLPAEDAGCPMADMITPEDILELKAEHPHAAVICYVNSSAAVKAVSDICCTSSSAERIVGALKEQEIIFVPDRNLGAYIAKKFPEKVFILFNGFCPRHNIVNEKDVLSIKESYPEAKFLAHPECREEVLKYADYIGSTSGILDYARRSEENQFIIGTELGICQILRREMPEKTFVPVTGDIFCINMKKTKLEDVLDCLEGRRKPIEIPAEDFAGAARSLERMVAAE